MIASVTGTISYTGPNYLVIETPSGVGYKIFVPRSFLSTVNCQLSTVIYTHTHVREDVLALYGFQTREELDMFELLLTVNGVGPKLALEILSSYSPDQIAAAIAGADEALFQTVSGLGKKNAAKIIIELKNKISSLGGSMVNGQWSMVKSEGLGEVVNALVSLGYSGSEAKSAIVDLNAGTPLEENLKLALKNLAGRS